MKTRKLITLFGICLVVIADYLLLMDTSGYSFYWRFLVYAFVIISSYTIGIIYQKKISGVNARLQPTQFVIAWKEDHQTFTFLKSYKAFSTTFTPSIYDAYYFPDYYHAEIIIQTKAIPENYLIIRINP